MEDQIYEIVCSKLTEFVAVMAKAITEDILENINNSDETEGQIEAPLKEKTILPKTTKKISSPPPKAKKLTEDEKKLLGRIDNAKGQGKYYNVSTGRSIGDSQVNRKNPELVWYNAERIVGKTGDKKIKNVLELISRSRQISSKISDWRPLGRLRAFKGCVDIGYGLESRV